MLEKIAKWEAVSAQSAALVLEERQLRKEIFDGCFQMPREGQNKVTLPDGRVLKGLFKLSYTIDKAALTENWNNLYETAGAGLVFQSEPKFIVAQYKLLPDEKRRKLDSVLVIKPALPSLEIVEARVK